MQKYRKRVKFYQMYNFDTGEKIGELKFDPFRKELQWTALLEKTGTFGGEEFLARVGDFHTGQDAEKALRVTEQKRKELNENL